MLKLKKYFYGYMFKGTFQFKKLKKYLLRPRQAQLRKMDILFNLQSENDFRIVSYRFYYNYVIII